MDAIKNFYFMNIAVMFTLGNEGGVALHYSNQIQRGNDAILVHIFKTSFPKPYLRSFNKNLLHFRMLSNYPTLTT